MHLEDRNGTTEVSTEEDAVVILGAHIDSVNWLNPWFGRSPGADDDGSGIPSNPDFSNTRNGYTPRDRERDFP